MSDSRQGACARCGEYGFVADDAGVDGEICVECAAEEAMVLREELAAARDELSNIANARRFDGECFGSDREFADWAQSRARFTLEKLASGCGLLTGTRGEG